MFTERETRFRAWWSLVLLLPAAACGAGLITGIAANSGNDSAPPARAPEVTVTTVMPLAPAPNTTRTVVVANAPITSGTQWLVRLTAAGVTVDQTETTAVGQGGATQLTFVLATAPILANVADPALEDVPGELTVTVDGRVVAPAVPVTLARRPSAVLELPESGGQQFLSPLGQRLRLRVDGLRSTVPDQVQVLVTTPDPAGAGTVTRVGSDVQFEAAEAGGQRISVTMPGSAFPTAAQVVVRDAVAGESAPIDQVFYRPDVALALPSQGATTGGSLLTLIGTALVPLELDSGVSPPPYDFDRIQIRFEKGQRTTVLAAANFRAEESASDRLVFTMPPSPDGRPGEVDIVLRVDLGEATAEVVANAVFLFANPDPFFGPRGAVLDRTPVAVAAIQLDNAPSTAEAPDFIALTDRGGVAFLELLLAQQNGMFQPFGAPLQIGDHEVAAERTPRALAVGDFDDDGIPDLFLVNEGVGSAVHHLVHGQARPAPPLGAVRRYASVAGMGQVRVGRFDQDARPDLLLLPGLAADALQRPEVWLTRLDGAGVPFFVSPFPLPVRSFRYEAVEVADLDGDAVLDIALVSGTELKLDVVRGLGDGTFGVWQQIDLQIPGYTPDQTSPAVGLHACRDGMHQSLGLVLSGVLFSIQTPPVTVVLPQVLQPPPIADYRFVQPAPQNVFNVPAEPIGRSLAADIDQTPPIELVLAMRDEPEVISLGVAQFANGAFVPLFPTIEGAVIGGAETPVQITAVAFDTAFPATQLSGEAKAVFLVHEVTVDGVREKRLSTRLVRLVPGDPPKLLQPDAGESIEFPIEGVVGGNFHPISVAGQGLVRDIALAHRDPGGVGEVLLVANDGFGGFPAKSNRLSVDGLLPRSLTLVPAATGHVDGLVFVLADSRIGFWLHDPLGNAVQAPDALTEPLRELCEPPLATIDLDDATRVRIGDVDGDGLDDLVVLLSFAVTDPGPQDSRLALLRGKPSVQPGEFPFHQPTVLTAVHGNATSFVLADFAAEASSPPRLELALAVPTGSNQSAADGDFVRFFRWLPGAEPRDDRFVASSQPNGPQVLLAGSEPARVRAGDFDRDGRIDLLVAGRGDGTLSWFRNTSAPVDPQGLPDVDVGAFVEGLSSPFSFVDGDPTVLELADVNGDGNLDAVLFLENKLAGGVRSTRIATFLSAGTGDFAEPLYASPTRIGNRDAILAGDVGDWNRDGVPDLFLGWRTVGDINFRVLFGGTR